MRRSILSAVALSVAGIASIAAPALFAQTEGKLLDGKAAFGDWRNDKPGMRRLIRPQDLPAPRESPSAHNFVRVERRSDQKPVVPPGFEVNLFASGLAGPRTLRTAPNGDIFVAESSAGRKPPAFAIASGLQSSLRAARCGARRTNATGAAMT